MLMGIVTETCPAPECNLSEKDIEQFLDEMTSYVELFGPAYQRVEQLEWRKAYLQGLLGEASRKNTERIALELGEKVRSMQYFIGQSPWKAEPVIGIHQGLVAETLGKADGVVLIDESGMVKQGDDSVGVVAQYCGSIGKVANSQVGGTSKSPISEPNRISLGACRIWLKFIFQKPKRSGSCWIT